MNETNTDGLDPRTPRALVRPEKRGLRENLVRAALRLARALGGGYAISLEYPPPNVEYQRFGWGRPSHERLRELLVAHAAQFRSVIACIERYGEDLARIPRTPLGPGEPHWGQHWFTGVDAAALYTFIRERRPRRYHEIGSGNSTLFAARAVRDGGLSTRILSVDPHPRAEVDAICDEVLRAPLQEVDPARVASLESGDILLVDSSHYVLMNSDVTTFVLDVLPALPNGVLVGIHDIFLPDDYPWWLAERWYSEQYALAAWLLGAGGRVQTVFATHLVATDPSLRAGLDAAWERAGLSGILAYGSCFWFET